MSPFEKPKEIVKKLPVIKPHLDFIAALLTIPVLLTVIILNFSNLFKPKTPTSPTPAQQTITAVPITQTITTPTPTDSPNCKQAIGPISITEPQEGDTITANPVCITISYQGAGYCSVVWAYSVNSGPQSTYSDNSVCLYNMPAGQINFQLFVKSLTSDATQTLTRTFVYQPQTSPTPNTSTPTPTPAPTSTPTPTPAPTSTPTPTLHP